MTKRTSTAVRVILRPYGITYGPAGFRYGDLPIYPLSVVARSDRDEQGRQLAGWVVLRLYPEHTGWRIGRTDQMGVLRWRKQGDTRLCYDLIWEPAALLGHKSQIQNWLDPAVLHGAMQYDHGAWRQVDSQI